MIRATIIRVITDYFVPCRFFLGVQNNIVAAADSNIEVYDSAEAPIEALDGIGLMEDIVNDYTLVQDRGTITQDAAEGRTDDCMKLDRTNADSGGVHATDSSIVLPELRGGRSYTLEVWCKGDASYAPAVSILVYHPKSGLYLGLDGKWGSQSYAIIASVTTSYAKKILQFQVPKEFGGDGSFVFQVVNTIAGTGVVYVDDVTVKEDPICVLPANNAGTHLFLSRPYETGPHGGVYVRKIATGEVQIHVSH